MSEELEYKNIFDAVTDDKDEAARMKEHADLLLLKRQIEDLNDRCDTLRRVGVFAIRGDVTNYWARLTINNDKEVCTTLESGYGHKSIEDAVTALFFNYTEWLDSK